MPHAEVDFTLTVRGALALRGGARDARGRLVLPASQVKGRLRHACEQVARAVGLAVCRPPDAATMCPQAPQVAAPPCAVCALFGSPAWPSPLRWRDLHASLEPAGGRGAAVFARAGVALDRRLGVALPGSAYLLETSPPLPGDGLQFAAEPAVVGHVADAAPLHLLLAGCRLVASFGAGATRGLGWSAVEAVARLDGAPLVFDPMALGRLDAGSGGPRGESQRHNGP
ncbi:MAG TPA: RAMP superfamily CRISPR-associated protein [Chloroflexota bacterium]|nr:RAMP superfamily CRISPR-associated protein [Chloroflexota bacterium]